MNLTDFKLHGEDADSYHLMHPTGRKIVLKKKGLSDKAHAAIKSIQHFERGGTVQPTPNELDAAVDAEAAANASANQPRALVDNTPGTNAAAAPAPASIAEPVPESAAPTAVAPFPPMAAAANPVNPFQANAASMDAINNQQIADAENYVKSVGGANAQGSSALDKEATQRVATAAKIQELSDNFNAKDETLTKAVADGHLDPNHYWNSKSTGSKVLSGIGLILSGMGSATTGGTNLAYDHIKNSINNDIDAQKNSQDKSMNLWKMNRSAYETDKEATLATQNQLTAATIAQVQKSTAAASSAHAKLQGQQLITQLKSENQARHNQLAIMQMGQTGQIDPAAYIGAVVDPKEQPEAYKDLDRVSKDNARSNNLLRLWDQVAAEKAAPSRANLGIATPSEAALDSEIDAWAKDREGRVNPMVIEDLKKNKPVAADITGKNAILRKNLVPLTNEGSGSALLDRYRVPYQKGPGSVTPQQQTFLNWAKANPNDPRAAVVLKKLGVR